MTPRAYLSLIQDALDLIEFVRGPADSIWGSVRNKMGRSKPWELNYFAIGNEVSINCYPASSACAVAIHHPPSPIYLQPCSAQSLYRNSHSLSSESLLS